MNPKAISRSTAVMAGLAAWLAASLSAYAFYNPSTGRWLSRDPLDESDGPTLLGFAHNSPVDGWDYLGLCGPVSQCGPDVTTPLLATIANIKITFGTWKWPQKCVACAALYSPWARGAWGVDKITQLGFPSPLTGLGTWKFDPPAVQGGPPPCDLTVAYKQNCYNASDVNYLMWGAINKLCWRSMAYSGYWSLTWAQASAIAWKEAHHEHNWHRVVGAVAFTRAGWQDTDLDLGSGERWLVRESSCTITPTNKASEPAFRWQWWPYAPLWNPRPWPLPGG